VLTDYPDNEYDKEFGNGQLAAATVTPTSSVSTVAGIQGPLYRWVRINSVTEKSLNFDVDNDNSIDPGLIYYDGSHLTTNPNPPSSQALEITSLAVLPNGSQKIVQYVVAPVNLGLKFLNPPAPNFTFPAALTLVGSTGKNVVFAGPGDPSFFVNGKDQFNVGGCAPAPASIPAIAYANGSDSSSISAAPPGNYIGSGGNSTTPSTAAVSLPPEYQTPSGLESLVQTITENADVVLTPNPPLPPGSFQTYTQSDLPVSSMSPSNPMTIVVNGDLNVNNWAGTGYGLLVVRGTFNYDPSSNWNGIVMVIGQGKYYSDQDGTGQITGAMLMATTRDPSGALLPAFGSPSFVQKQSSPPPSGNGIYYSSCWIKAVQTPVSYKVLSFHEILQQ
jgi:hypothetical protein